MCGFDGGLFVTLRTRKGRLCGADSHVKCNTFGKGCGEWRLAVFSSGKKGCSMGYHQLTAVERYLIVEHKSTGKSLREIAKALCRSASTISRELKRNACTSDGRYRVEKAQSYAKARRSRCRRGVKFEAAWVAEVHRLVQRKWSPEQVSRRLLKEGRLPDVQFARAQGRLPADRCTAAGTEPLPQGGTLPDRVLRL